MPEKSRWTPERMTQLRTLWAADLNAGEIASEMGCFIDCQDGGRHSVLSMAKRLRDEAKANKLNDEVRFWTRGKRHPPKHRGMGTPKRSLESPITRQQAVALIDSTQVARIEWPTDAEVQAAWIKQLTTVE